MLTAQEKIFYKTITFRLDTKIIEEFKRLCKKHDKKQVIIIEKAMRQAIKELNSLIEKK